MAPLTLPPFSVSPLASSGLLLPVPAIVFIAVGAYLVLLIIIIVVRQCLLERGFCVDCCSWGKDLQLGCWKYCLACAESCDCKIPSLNHCLDNYCPRSRDCDVGNCLSCSCCPYCDCACAFQPPDCESINCICFEIKMR
ncbi:uncharacterized protein SI:CH211-198P11.6 [Latimeria chalumnae]|uniref:uncharacterized protein SI:CH211-198P11.6 n=1 Tax=Latimeria chalumnae TaxID=7897 RepID=UPI0006D90E0C|nr:PREDICTED: uncharacterized protein LOC106706984 [Latimeria chalumnae]|eukprot:XP_014354153.1 PREDICTED: uncharacterized protein LOC106706984 [Latimeria chalumnae]